MSFFDGKNVLVTGAAGFVGASLIKKLSSSGALIRGAIHTKKPDFDHKNVEYFSCDLTKAYDCKKAVEGIDCIFHCAASTSGAAVITKSPLTHVTPNIIMNAQLFEAAYYAKVEKLLWLGSSTGYPDGEKAFKEDEIMLGDPYEKYFCVGWMKRYTEILCRMYSQKIKDPLCMIVLRPTNIYGPGDDFDFATSHVLPALIRRVLERQNPINVWGTGDDLRDLIFIDDMVDAMVLAMEQLNQYDAFNIGLGKIYSIKEMLNIILELEKFEDAKIIFDPSKPSTIPKRAVDISKAKKVLGFTPRVDLKQGIQKTVEWYKTAKHF